MDIPTYNPRMLLTLAFASIAFGLLVLAGWITYPGPMTGSLNENSRGVVYLVGDTQKATNGYV